MLTSEELVVVCLEGTPALYYHRKGTGSGANKWFLHQQGEAAVSAEAVVFN